MTQVTGIWFDRQFAKTNKTGLVTTLVHSITSTLRRAGAADLYSWSTTKDTMRLLHNRWQWPTEKCFKWSRSDLLKLNDDPQHICKNVIIMIQESMNFLNNKAMRSRGWFVQNRWLPLSNVTQTTLAPKKRAFLPEFHVNWSQWNLLRICGKICR